MPHRGRPTLRKRLTLRARLTIWVVSIFVLIQVVTGLGFWLYQRSADRGLFNDRLVKRSMLIASRIRDEYDFLDEESLDALVQRTLDPLEFGRFQVDVVDAQGVSLLRRETRWPVIGRQIVAQIDRAQGYALRAVPDAPAGFESTEITKVFAIGVSVPQIPNAYLVVVTTDTFYARQTALILRILLVGGLFGTFASMVSGWIIAGVAVEPLRRLAGIADKLVPTTVKHASDEPMLDQVEETPEIQQLANELHAAKVRIREAFAAQERFLSNISHEIKTPIATLQLEAQTLDRKRLPPEGREFIESAEDEMRKLGRLVESFLTLTRVRDGQGEATPHRCGANELVMESLEDCVLMAEQHSVRLDVQLADSEEALDATVAGDPELLRTMINNLVRNAIRFTPRNGRVRVLATVRDAKFCIAVRDEGPGLPPELLEEVFNRFVQSSDETRRKRGHGLGLAIAQGIAELHGGQIRVRNLDPKGAEFTAELPLLTPDATEPADPAPNPEPESDPDPEP